MVSGDSSQTPFLTIAEVALRWKCSEKKIRRLIQRGALAAYRFDGQWRLRDVDLVAYERLCRLEARVVPDVR